MSESGEIIESCGDGVSSKDKAGGFDSPLALLSDVYFVEVLFQPADNKRKCLS